MANIGIIAEFNPFHNGHSYLIREAKAMAERETGEEPGVVICMSGNYVQRGSAAVFDKYLRAESALTDADCVFELPVLWATADAGNFAGCGVDLLRKTCIIDFLAFGIEASEENKDAVISSLNKAADILAEEPEGFKERLKELLSAGQSYPAARQTALLEISDIAPDTLSTSNNILAIEYLTAIRKTGSNIKPVFVSRIGSGYNDTELNGSFSSATAIRESMKDTDLREYIPAEALDVIEPFTHFPILTEEYLLPYITSAMRNLSEQELLSIRGMNEDLLGRLMKAPLPSSFSELADYMKTRNVTMTRIRRLLLSLALGIKKSDLLPAGRITSPNYINLLAMRKDASQIVKSVSESEELTVINKKSSYRPEDALSELSWFTDIRTTDIYNQMFYTCTGEKLPKELRSNIRLR